MPTEKPRFSITIDQELLQKVDDYRHEKKLKSQTQAILDLVTKGMQSLASEDEQVADAIRKASESTQLDPEARTRNHIELFAKALSKAGMLDKNQNLSSEDCEFLQAMLLAIRAHFKQGKE